MKVLFKDKAKATKEKQQAEWAVKAVKPLADIWNKQQIMGKMTRKEFDLLLERGHEYFMEAFYLAIRQNEAKVRGAAFYDLVDPRNYSPIPHDGDATFDITKIIRGVESVNRQGQYIQPNYRVVEFKNGEPFVSEKSLQTLEDGCIIYGTKENLETLAQGEAAAETLNILLAKGYEIKVGEPFKMIEDNKIEFDTRTLKYGK